MSFYSVFDMGFYGQINSLKVISYQTLNLRILFPEKALSSKLLINTCAILSPETGNCAS